MPRFASPSVRRRAARVRGRAVVAVVRVVRVVAVVAVFAIAIASAPARADAVTLAESAKSAAAAGNYCEALALYTRTFGLTNDPKHLFNAAEVAFAADDKVTSLQLFRELLAKFPTYPKRAKVQQRIGELGRSIAKDGAGNACTAAPTTATPPTAPTAPTASATCGNSIIDDTETCDDGNRVEGDGCDSNCTRTSCGNAIRTSGELCDDGNSVVGDGCDHNCTISVCGNGVIAGPEQCDDGNTSSGDGCTAECTTEVVVAPVREAASPLPWIVGGSVTAAVGAVAGIVGFMPAIGYASRAPELAALERNFKDADDAAEQATIGADVAAANAAQAADVDSYNTWGRWLAPAGIALVGAGVVVAIVGVLVSGGEEGAE